MARMEGSAKRVRLSVGERPRVPRFREGKQARGDGFGGGLAEPVAGFVHQDFAPADMVRG
jgi:hypothetical protein